MTGVQLGGIDPSILRELSGVYKPFVKALKELVSNAFDADADHVHITIADDFASITVELLSRVVYGGLTRRLVQYGSRP
jgi:hypothetical protein